MFVRAVLSIFIAITAGIGAALTEPGISGSMDNQHKTLSKIFVSQNVDTSKFFLDPNDPIVKRMGDSIEKLNAFYERYNRLIRLGNPFQMENEPGSLIRNGVDGIIIRQTKETRWLAKVVSHKMKLIGIQKKLWFVYNKLQQDEEIDSEELESMKESVSDLERSEELLREKTQNFILYVLQN